MFSVNRKLKRGVVFSTKKIKNEFDEPVTVHDLETKPELDPLSKKARKNDAEEEGEEVDVGGKLAALKQELAERKRVEAENRARLEREMLIQKRVEVTNPELPGHHLWMDIVIHHPGVAEKTKGRLVIELFDDLMPHSTRKFLELALADRDPTYKGAIFSFIKSSGFVEAAPAKKSRTVYRGDEIGTSTAIHTLPGIVALSDPAQSNAFTISLTPNCSELDDGRHVIIGRVVSGLAMLLEIGKEGSTTGEAKKKVEVVELGDIVPTADKPISSYFKEPEIPDLKRISDPKRMKVKVLPNVQAVHWMRTG